MKYFWALLSLTFLLLFCGSAQAQDQLRAVGTHYPPFRIIDPASPMGMTGVHPDVISAMANCLGATPSYADLPLKRALKELQHGTLDVYLGLLRTPEREKLLIYVEPPYRTDSHKAFYVRKGEGYRLTKFEDLKKLSKGVGYSKGAKYFKAFDEAQDIPKEPAINTLLSLRMLLANRVDAVIATDGVADYIVIENSMQSRVEKAPWGYFDKVPAYLTVSRTSPWAKRMDEVNACMRQLVESGEIERIVDNAMNKYDLHVGSPTP